MSEKQRISILGAGSWGTTLAVMLAGKHKLEVTLWSAFAEHAGSMRKKRENIDFLPGTLFPESLSITDDPDAAAVSDILICAVPVQFMRSILQRIKGKAADKIIVSVSKGIELATLKTPYEMIFEELEVKKENIVILSGPTIAAELASGMPAVACAASVSEVSSSVIQKIFEGTSLRIYSNTDVYGVELAGALKNVLAIACGISDGLGFGTNAKSALVTRGLREMMIFGKLNGASEDTFAGIAGLGDLCTTCFSSRSRNRGLGERIGRGEKLCDILASMKMVAEGVVTAKSVYNIAVDKGIELPIVTEVYKMLYEDKPPVQAVKDLMSRPLKAE